jgi:GntR family transcriptional repressor for pyruvate dehydrogenase complex
MSEGRLADRAYTGIVEMINADGLAVGDRLPSEARLAEIFGMSRTVVREALVRLAADSITEARRGAGSFVKNRPSDKLSAYMPLSELPSTLGSYEVRFVLEAEAARLAAARRSPRRWPASKRALVELREALLSNAPAHAEDMELHRRIVLATANPAFLSRVRGAAARRRPDHARRRRHFALAAAGGDRRDDARARDDRRSDPRPGRRRRGPGHALASVAAGESG